MRYAVIMAGGAGKRLWPMSREGRPKQLLRLLEGKSLIELAVERLEGLFEPANIWIITNAQYVEQIAAALPALPRENIVGEPEGRDTANAVALAAELIAARDPEAVMAVFTADHVIRPTECFSEAVRRACDAAERHADALLTFGVQPTWPHTGLGYIQCGAPVDEGVREVAAFKEKPEHRLARQYVESGKHFWNSGMFVWTVHAIRENLRRFLPDSMARLEPVEAAAREGRPVGPILEEVYPTLEKISIDFAVMEKAPRVLMVELRCEWLDVGSWPALRDVLERDETDNVVVAERAVLVDSMRNVVVSEDDHLLAVLGMEDCVIIHTADATLVCNRADAQRLKELVGVIETEFGEDYV